MAIAFVQNASAFSAVNVTTLGATFVSDTTTGNLIIVAIGFASNTTQTAATVTDGTNSYTQLYQHNQGTSGAIDIWVAKNITGAVAPTVTITTIGNSTPYISLTEVSGLATTQPIDSIWSDFVNTASQGLRGVDTPTMKTPNNLILFAEVQPATTPSLTVGTGFSNLQTLLGITSFSMGVQSKVVASTAPLSSTITTNQTNTAMPIVLLILSDTNLQPYQLRIALNNYQFVRVPNGMSSSEKIR